MTRIKICGITNLEDAIEALKLGVDFLGFIFAESPRKISKEKARRIIDSLKGIKTVGVFSDQSKEEVMEIAHYCNLDILQFHGNESPDYCRAFPSVIKAFRVKDHSSLVDIPKYEVDYILLDTFVSGVTGGTGKTFDQSLAMGVYTHGKLILSGGLNADNVREAIQKVKPFAVDVCSGVERAPGKKDLEKMRAFVERVGKGWEG